MKPKSESPCHLMKTQTLN